MGLFSNFIKKFFSPKLPKQSTEVKKTLKEIEKVRRQKNKLIEKFNDRYKNSPVYVQFDTTGTKRTVGEHGHREKKPKFEKKFTKYDDLSEMKNYLERMNRLTDETFYLSDERWRSNTISTLARTFGDSADIIIKLIENVDLETFVRTMHKYDVDLDYFYAERNPEMLDEVMEWFQEALETEAELDDFDLDDFYDGL